MSDQDPSYGHNEATSPTSGFNSLQMAIQIAKNAMMTCTIVKVKKCTNEGDVKPIGRVDVLPLVQMIDGVSRTVDHVQVYNLPYFRLVAGDKAIIMDPKEDDIGIVVVADRDISAVKKSKKVSPPGSRRRYNISDGIFLGSVLSGGENDDPPKNYIQFMDDGTIKIAVDEGNTYAQVKKDEVSLKVPGQSVYLRPGRVDLGMKDAPHAVVTVDGPSEKVFAVIGESDG